MQWHTPIGYEISDGKIVINEEHSKTVIEEHDTEGREMDFSGI